MRSILRYINRDQDACDAFCGQTVSKEVGGRARRIGRGRARGFRVLGGDAREGHVEAAVGACLIVQGAAEKAFERWEPDIVASYAES